MKLCAVCRCSIEHKHKLAKFCSNECKNTHWQNNNWDRVLATAKKYRLNHEKTPAQKRIVNEQSKTWKQNNITRKRALEKAYHQRKQGDREYLAKRRHYEAVRRARKLQATPKWLTKTQLKEIKTIYLNCPDHCEVDHIIPLKGKEVSGLHVPWNLQYLPGVINRIKHNKVYYGHTN